MTALAEAQVQGVWFDRSKVEEAEYKYQEYLVRKSGVKGEIKTVKGDDKLVKGDHKKVETTASRVAQQIAEARKQIQETLKDSYASTGTSAGASDNIKKEIDELRKEHRELIQQVSALASRFESLESRLSVIEGGASQTTAVTTQNKVEDKDDDDDDDSDVDLFGSDSEEDEEAERLKAERVAAYNERKSKKTAVIAKSSILLDIKPWDDETDMKEVERLVRTISCDGLLWGASKFVKVAFGIVKLQISCVVEDDKVGTDFLEEEITKFEDHVQSVDIAAFNKI